MTSIPALSQACPAAARVLCADPPFFCAPCPAGTVTMLMVKADERSKEPRDKKMNLIEFKRIHDVPTVRGYEGCVPTCGWRYRYGEMENVYRRSGVEWRRAK